MDERKVPDPRSGPVPTGFRNSEFTVPSLAAEQSRYEFLQAVRRRCPRPLWHLRNRIYPFYSRWVDDFMEGARASHQWKQSPEALEWRREMADSFRRMGMTDSGAEIAAEGRPIVGLDPDDAAFNTFLILEYEHPRLDHLLKLWAQRNSLTHQVVFEEYCEADADETESFSELTLHKDYWACRWALVTMWCWKFLPEGVEMMNSNPPEWVRAYGGTVGSSEPPFRIRPGWDVLTETESTFRDRVENALTAYIESCKQLARARGLVETRGKRQLSHFDWLALYQVSGWSYAQIADWEQQQAGGRTLGDDSIRKGLRLAAEVCGLNARPGSPGRPTIRK